MADIVERLREYGKDWRDRAGSNEVVTEAADEILRLRAALTEAEDVNVSPLLVQRDAFIISEGLWTEFTAQLDRPPESILREFFGRAEAAESALREAREVIEPFAQESLFAGPQHDFVSVKIEWCDRARAFLSTEKADG